MSKHRDEVLKLTEEWITRSSSVLQEVEDAVNANPNLTIDNPIVTVKFKEAQTLLKCALAVRNVITAIDALGAIESP